MLTLRWRPFGRSWGQFLTPDEQMDIQKELSNLKTKTEASLCREDDREILAVNTDRTNAQRYGEDEHEAEPAGQLR